MKHHNPAHHKAMAEKAKQRGDMEAYKKHMAEAKEAAKRKKK